jgi:hypothetical protein
MIIRKTTRASSINATLEGGEKGMRFQGFSPDTTDYQKTHHFQG